MAAFVQKLASFPCKNRHFWKRSIYIYIYIYWVSNLFYSFGSLPFLYNISFLLWAHYRRRITFLKQYLLITPSSCKAGISFFIHLFAPLTVDLRFLFSNNFMDYNHYNHYMYILIKEDIQCYSNISWHSYVCIYWYSVY